MKFYQKSQEEKAQYYEEKQKQKVLDFEQQIGLRQIFKILTQSNKPIIGHSCVYDWLFLFSHLYGDLPQSVNDFKDLFNSLFPAGAYDTKQIFEQTPRLKQLSQNSSLGQLFENLKCQEILPFAEGFQIQNEQCHDSGFDSYMTASLTEEEKTLHLNKWQIFQSLYVMNLSGEDILLAPLENIFLISNFPREWKTQDLNNLFQPEDKYSIRWVSESNVIVIVEENAEGILERLQKHEGIEVKTLSEQNEIQRKEQTNRENQQKSFRSEQNHKSGDQK